MKKTTLLLLTSAVFAGACGPDGHVTGADKVNLAWGPASNQLFKPPEEGGATNGIVGDWFECRDLPCTRLDNEGIRFTADGRTVQLASISGRVEQGATYCERAGAGGTYTYDPGTQILTVMIQGQFEQAKMVIDGDRATLVVDNGGLLLKRIDPPNSAGSCGDVIRVPSTGGGTSSSGGATPPPR